MDDKIFIKNSLLFDAGWYCKTYGYGEYLDAAEHYLKIGWREGKNPSAFFSTANYLQKNPDVAGADLNPLLHFEKYGVKEGRYRAEIKKVLPAIFDFGYRRRRRKFYSRKLKQRRFKFLLLF